MHQLLVREGGREIKTQLLKTHNHTYIHTYTHTCAHQRRAGTVEIAGPIAYQSKTRGCHARIEPTAARRRASASRRVAVDARTVIRVRDRVGDIVAVARVRCGTKHREVCVHTD